MNTNTLQKPRAKTAIKAVAVKLDEADRNSLESLAAYKNRSAHYLMREAIHEYIQKEEVERRFVAAAEASSREFQETGLHITMDEMSAWLATWGTPNEQPMPICHT